MELFKITETFEVELNKEWIMLIPSLAAVLRADKGSKGDSEGRKKLYSRKQLAYIYFMIDFKSPINSWDYAERHTEALKYSDLTEKDVANPLVQEALAEYERIQIEAARSLKTLQAARKGLNALDKYLNDVDFTSTDKQGKLLHSPKEFVTNLQQLNKAYDELTKFEKRVHEELKESTTIRGSSTLGDMEHRRTGTEKWEEGAAPDKERVLFTDLTVEMNKVVKKDEEDNVS